MIIDFDLLFVVSKLAIQTPKLMQHFDVARVFFEQRPQREYANLRPTRRYRRFLQNQICLSIVGLLFQNFFQHFDCAFRILFEFSLRLHDSDRRRRDIEKTFLSRLVFRDLRTSQQLAAREKLGLLLKNFLEERNRVTEIAQLNRRQPP